MRKGDKLRNIQELNKRLLGESKTIIKEVEEKVTEKTSKPENIKRLNESLVKLLNEQITNELSSSQIYRAMSCWLDDKGWVDASKKYFSSSDEELSHMRKIYEYIFSRNCLAEVQQIPAPESNFTDIRDVVNKSLEHEIQVSEEWTKISETAKKLGDDTTYEFAQWFLKEQIEEEEKFRNILFKMNLDMPKWKIDELFS